MLYFCNVWYKEVSKYERTRRNHDVSNNFHKSSIEEIFFNNCVLRLCILYHLTSLQFYNIEYDVWLNKLYYLSYSNIGVFINHSMKTVIQIQIQNICSFFHRYRQFEKNKQTKAAQVINKIVYIYD